VVWGNKPSQGFGAAAKTRNARGGRRSSVYSSLWNLGLLWSPVPSWTAVVYRRLPASSLSPPQAALLFNPNNASAVVRAVATPRSITFVDVR
jgi:hypothetical protein